jgi:hypothetical protein
MKLIIAGCRHFDEEEIYTLLVNWRIENHPMVKADEIVSGTATGVDAAGEWYADFYDVPVKKFPPNWNAHGKAAGPIRNSQMAQYADALLLIWDGQSRGSASMKKEMLKLNKPVYEVVLKIK